MLSGFEPATLQKNGRDVKLDFDKNGSGVKVVQLNLLNFGCVHYMTYFKQHIACVSIQKYSELTQYSMVMLQNVNVHHPV